MVPGGVRTQANVAVNLRAAGGRGHELRDADLGVREGEVFGLLDSAHAGVEALLAELLGERAYRSGQAVRPPRRDEIMPYATVNETVTLFAALYRASEWDLRRCSVPEALALAGLAERAHERVDALAAADRAKLTIAIAAVANAPLIVLTEPVAGLDAASASAVVARIGELRALGRTVLVTAAQLDHLALLCDRVAILQDGGVIAVAEPSALADRARTRAAIAFRLDSDTRQAFEVSAFLEEISTLAPPQLEAVREGVNVTVYVEDAEAALRAVTFRRGLHARNVRVLGPSSSDATIFYASVGNGAGPREDTGSGEGAGAAEDAGPPEGVPDIARNQKLEHSFEPASMRDAADALAAGRLGGGLDVAWTLARIQVQALLRETNRRWALIICAVVPILAYVLPLIGALGARGFAPEHVVYGEMSERAQRVALVIPVLFVIATLGISSYQLAIWLVDLRRSGMLGVLRRTPLRPHTLSYTSLPLSLGLALVGGALLSGLAALYAGVPSAPQTLVTVVSMLLCVVFASSFAFLLGARLRTETGVAEAVFVLAFIGGYAIATLIPLEGPWAVLNLVNPASWHVVPLASGMLGAATAIPLALFWGLSLLGSAACVFFGSRCFRWEELSK